MNKIVATLITPHLLFLFFVSVSSHSLDHGSKDINNLSGVISTSHPMATMAGEAILIKGGNSVDAAIAASLVLSVVEPTMSGLGGRAQAIVSNDKQNFVGYNGMTEIPKAFKNDNALPSYGYQTVAVPGLVALLAKMHNDFGSLPFSSLTDPAIKHASEGIKFLPGERTRQLSVVEKIFESDGMRHVYIDESGDIHPNNKVVIQEALANTLKKISTDPHNNFYFGDIAKIIVDDSSDNGGFINIGDLNNYEILPGNYFSFKYRDRTIHTLAAPAGGLLVAKTLSILNQYEYSDFDEDRWAALVSQALALSIKSMSENYYEEDPLKALNIDWINHQTLKISLPKTNNLEKVYKSALEKSKTDWVQNSNSHTSHISVFDCDGLAISMTQTLGPIFGAKVSTKELGFPYAATMGGYLRTGEQKPGQRPRTSIAPVIVTKDGQVDLVLGAAGGIRIPSAITQTLSRIIDQGLTLERAISAPRVHPSMTINSENERVINLNSFEAEASDQGWNDRNVQYWEKSGFNVNLVHSRASFGRVNAVTNKSSVIMGQSDPDWEGSATASIKCGR